MNLLTLFNWITTIIIAIIGATMGAEYTNPHHLTILILLVAYTVGVQLFIINPHNDLRQKFERKKDELSLKDSELQETKDKLSNILIQSKLSKENNLHFAVFPKNVNIKVNQPVNATLIINTPNEVAVFPDVKITTDFRWGQIKFQDKIINPHNFANKFEYILSLSRSSAAVLQNGNKYCELQFNILFNKVGIHNYVLTVESDEFKAQMMNMFEVLN